MNISYKQQRLFQNSALSSLQGKVTKVIMSILILIVVAVFIALYFTRGISDIAREQLAAIKSENLAAAYSLTSQAFQKETSMNKFTNFVNQSPIFKKYKDVTFNDRKIENGSGYLSGMIEGSDGSKMKIEYQLIKENDKWKIQAERLSTVGADESDTNKQSST